MTKPVDCVDSLKAVKSKCGVPENLALTIAASLIRYADGQLIEEKQAR
jgi:hypothetical protein